LPAPVADREKSAIKKGDPMRTKFILFILLLTAVAISSGSNEARAATSVQVATPGFNFSLNDYQPAPANVTVYHNEGRPYYVEHDHRVYMEKKHHGHKKYKKPYKNKGQNNGHGKH
jgi:hypothetical protein